MLEGAACTDLGRRDEDYPAKIAAIRAAKDDSFKNDPDSPVPADKKAALLPLAYFPIDESYAVPATLEPAAERTRIQVPTSTGKIRNIERIGTLKFSLQGKPMRLTAFIDVESPQVNRLFVPFADQTSGTETYAAGRYMELDPTPPASTSSTSTSPTTRTATTARSSTARFRRRRTVSTCRSAPVSVPPTRPLPRHDADRSRSREP